MRKFTLLFIFAFIGFGSTLFAQTEQSLYSTNFQDWTSLSPSLSTNYGESFTATLTDLTLQASAAKGVCSANSVRFEKAATAAFVTTSLASVTKVALTGYTTGSARGFSLYHKTATDLDWVEDATKIVLQAGETFEVAVNQTDVQLKIVNNPNTQYYYLTDLEIFGMTSVVVPIYQSSTPAANTTIPTSGTIDLVFDATVVRGTGDITIGSTLVAESNISINGATVTIAYSGLNTDDAYDLVVPAGAFKDINNAPTAASTTLSFTTPDTQAPVCSFQTDENSTVPTLGVIALLFNEPVKAGSAAVTIGSVNITPAVSASQNYLVYLNYSGLDFDTDYTVTIPDGAITDLYGNSMAPKSFTISTEGNYKGAKLLNVSPNSTDFPTTIALGDVTKAYTGEDALTNYDVTFGNIGTPADRGSNGWGFKTDYVLLPKTKIGAVSFKIQCGGGSSPQKYYIQKLGVDGITWANMDTIMIGTNDVITFTSAVAQAADSTTIRLFKDGSNFWFYNATIYDYLDNNAANDDGLNPSVVSTLPAASAADVATSGLIKLTFSESVKSGSASFILDGKTLTPSVLGKVVTLPYNNLKYGTAYSLTIEAGAITDYLSNACAASTVSFTTKAKPAVNPALYDFVVAQDGSGDGLTIQSAFDAVPSANTAIYRIFVKNGTYNEYPSLADGKTNVSLIGQNIDKVIITGNHYSGLTTGGVTYGTSTCQTLEIFADNFYCENITVANTAGVNAGQAVAVKVYSDKAVFKNVRMLSYQDTHITSNVATDRQYYLNCDIHGTVDFIFNDGVAYFDQTRLYIEDRSSANVICAPATSTSNTYGYVFNGCTIDGASSQDGVYLLGRPWKNAPKAVYLNTTMNIQPNAAAWTTMSALPSLFVEYNSVSRNGSPVVLNPLTDFSFTSGTLVNDSLSSTRLSTIDATAAANYTLSNVLGGTDSWDATSKLDVPAAVENLAYNSTTTSLSWTASDAASCYIVTVNDSVVGFTTTTDFALADVNVQYGVIAVSEYGALSTVSTLGTNTAVKSAKIKTGFLASTLVQNEITLKDADIFETVSIINVSAQEVLSTSVVSSSINVSSLTSGYYLVKGIAKDGDVYVDKIVKK